MNVHHPSPERDTQRTISMVGRMCASGKCMSIGGTWSTVHDEPRYTIYTAEGMSPNDLRWLQETIALILGTK